MIPFGFLGKGAASAPTMPSGLVAAYGLDETSGTNAPDATSNGYDGTLINSPSWATGKYGNGVSFTSNTQTIDLGNPAGLQITGDLTISAWINASSWPGDDAAVVSKRGSSYGFQLDTTGDRGFRGIGFKLTRDTDNGQMFRYGATTLSPSTWYHIAGVYDASAQEMHVYLNGSNDDGDLIGTVDTAQVDPSSNVTIANRFATDVFPFTGVIDEVRIYDRALSESEIATDMGVAIADYA